MKLSIAWIFDHLDADWTSVDIPTLINRFNCSTAEIERSYALHSDISSLRFARVTALDDQLITLACADSNSTYCLPARPGIAQDQWYLIKLDSSSPMWATAADLGSSKDYLLPAFYGNASTASAWRTQLELRDVIIEIDNKSITNRPDLWGHRGIARELSVLLGIPFKSLDAYVAQVPVQEADKHTSIDGYTIANKAPEACKRFAAVSMTTQRRPSLLWMAHRLLRVDARPIDTLVDATNYVMFDVGQPLHAFDAQKLSGKTLIPQWAHAGQKLTLLDGQTIELTRDDLVIHDGTQPVALAGIMGGQSTAVSQSTTHIMVEAACFDAGTIRKSAAHHKKRTDASARFEKSLDPNQNVVALQRFVRLIQDAGMQISALSSIASLGARVPDGTIAITHDFIQQRLGVKVDKDFIQKTLEGLGFGFQEESAGHYRITVPTFRATKDITIPEDIVEEVARIWGYNRIEPVFPTNHIRPADNRSRMRLRIIKQMLAYRCGMTELSCYPFFDESFLHTIAWQPQDAVSVQNPVSEHWRRLATSLLPMLCRAVHENYAVHDTLRFFQEGRVWSMHNGTINERAMVAGIFFDKHQPLDFYAIKAKVLDMFRALGVNPVWRKTHVPHAPWYLSHQTAVLELDGVELGHFGMADPLFFSRVAEGHACLFEFSADLLLQPVGERKRYVPISKYPAVRRDISILIPLRYTTAEIMNCIQGMSPLITQVSLADFFEKPEWQEQRSITLHMVMQSPEKTLTKQEVDEIYANIAQKLTHTFNAVIR